MRIIVADTETTELDNPEIVQVAWQELDDNMEVISEFESLLNPGVPISIGASAINGIRTADIQGAPRIEDIKFPEGEVFLICHNLRFDMPLLTPWMDVQGALCTMLLARRIYRKAENHKLPYLSVYLDLPPVHNHNALEDVKNTVSLLRALLRDTESDIYELSEFFDKPYIYDIMPFGKYKGREMKYVPTGWLEWLSGVDPDHDMVATIAATRKKK